ARAAGAIVDSAPPDDRVVLVGLMRAKGCARGGGDEDSESDAHHRGSSGRRRSARGALRNQRAETRMGADRVRARIQPQGMDTEPRVLENTIPSQSGDLRAAVASSAAPCRSSPANSPANSLATSFAR